jgi:hypothetical protein
VRGSDAIGRDARATARAARAARRRRLGRGLVAFGVAGLVLIGAAGALVLASLGAVGDAATGFERQRPEILSMLGPASDALEGAASSATNAGASLAETKDAATQAAELMSRLATSFESLAALGEFEVFGARPFASLSGQFTDVATQSRTLSTSLTDAATAMATNVTDSAAVAADLRVLAGQLEDLEASLGGSGDGGTATPAADDASLPIDAARFVLVGLLAWLAVPAVASIWLGWRWSRAAPEA